MYSVAVGLLIFLPKDCFLLEAWVGIPGEAAPLRVPSPPCVWCPRLQNRAESDFRSGSWIAEFPKSLARSHKPGSIGGPAARSVAGDRVPGLSLAAAEQQGHCSAASQVPGPFWVFIAPPGHRRAWRGWAMVSTSCWVYGWYKILLFFFFYHRYALVITHMEGSLCRW